MQLADQDTIAAQATPPGRGGVGIIRVSGPDTRNIAEKVLGKLPIPRTAYYGNFYDTDASTPLDQGIAIYFPGPNSFTGEDILELQGHGGPVLLDLLLTRVLDLGVRLAKPGEFSERAFLNDKMDLAQAEAIADLIDSASIQAARSAMRSLQGEFSNRINALVENLIQLRIYVEAAIDFPEEEIDFLADGKVQTDLQQLIIQLTDIQNAAQQGSLMREGMQVVIAGRPNAGKSSLLNALSGRESAIVTAIEGTTRDVLREQIHIEGMPLHIIDTAGLRDAPDEVERIGIARAWEEIEKADRILLLVDSNQTSTDDPLQVWPEFTSKLQHTDKITLVRNKADLSGEAIASSEAHGYPLITLSAKAGQGIDLLKEHLKHCMGYQNSEGSFLARRRHLEALAAAHSLLTNGYQQLTLLGAGELLAEDLKQAQQALGEITGQFSNDDLLGRIFSSFCIGK